MQDLHGDLAVLSMHSIRHLSMLCGFTAGRQLAGKGLHPAGSIRRVAARNDQANIAARSFCKIGRQPVMFVAIFEAGMHRAHEYPIF